MSITVCASPGKSCTEPSHKWADVEAPSRYTFTPPVQPEARTIQEWTFERRYRKGVGCRNHGRQFVAAYPEMKIQHGRLLRPN